MPKRTLEESPDQVSSDGLSLKALLLGFVVLLVVVLLALSAALSFYQFREHLAERQQIQAQDAATALGLSLTNAIDASDRAAAAALINALFDHGHYARVRYLDTRGAVLVARDREAAGDQEVPGWFRALTRLPQARAGADVMQGWRQLGRIEVEVSRAGAYQALWQGFIRGVVSFSLVGLVAVILAWLGLRLILRPLHKLEHQAELLRAHRFGARVPIPRTRELASLAHAANHMAQEVESLVASQIRMIEDLRSQSRQDPLTGLDNRASFDQRLRAECDSEEHPCDACIALVSLTGFADFNRSQGYEAGDRLLRITSERLLDYVSTHPGAFAGRRQGADFALFLPGVEVEEAQHQLEQLADEVTVDIVAAGAEKVEVDIGYVLQQPPERSAEVLARADTALAQARSQASGGVVLGLTGSAVSLGGQRWRAALTEALARQRLRLTLQPTYAMDGQTLWFQQVLAQVEIAEEWVHAGQFLPLVERYGLAVQLDQAVLEATLEHLRQTPEGVFCLVLSTASLADLAFRRQAIASLKAVPSLNQRLWVAVHEEALRSESQLLPDLIPRLRELGVRVLVDRFGASGVSFDYLQRRVIDGIRIDRSFTRHVDSRPGARFFIQSVAPIAQGRGIKVFVAGVESEGEWQVARELAVDGAMGYYLGRPALLPVHST